MLNSPLSLDVEQVRYTLKDVLRLAVQQPYDKSTETLSDSPGKDYYGNHRDRFVQLLVRVMVGNGITWSLMITILSDPKRIRSSCKRTHRVRKFQVPDYVVELLEGLPFMVGFGIRGDVLAIDDTFSLMVGQDLELSGFFELGSLCLQGRHTQLVICQQHIILSLVAYSISSSPRPTTSGASRGRRSQKPCGCTR